MVSHYRIDHLDGGLYNYDEYLMVDMFNDFQYMIPHVSVQILKF